MLAPLSSQGEFEIADAERRAPCWDYVHELVPLELDSGTDRHQGRLRPEHRRRPARPEAAGPQRHRDAISGVKPKGGPQDYVKLARISRR